MTMRSLTRENGKGEKLCSANACPIVIPRYMLMCKTHWAKIPMPLRNRIWAAWSIYKKDMANAQALFELQQLQAEAIRLAA